MRTFIISIMLLVYVTSYSQESLEKKLSEQYNPLELVSINQNVSFNQAIKMLSAVSEMTSGKSIVSTVDLNTPIGVDIKKLPYMTALNLISNMMDLMYEDKDGILLVKKKQEAVKQTAEEDTYADITAREVRISAVFFEADIENSKERGIDWSVLFTKDGINLGSELRTKSELPQNVIDQAGKPPAFNLNSLADFNIKKWSGSATALFRFFESQNLGDIIASPSIVVRNKQNGRIQIGSDFSIKQRDFSGNIIDRFYSAGSIIDVTPYIYNKNNVDYILLKLNVERSAFFPTELTTEVKKTAATSDILLLDGEQTVIGGLYINEENKIRNGIPFLKDLPWWVFGIRYLTGSDQILNRKKEVIILLKAELLPMLEERLTDRSNDDLLKEQRLKNKSDLDNYLYDKAVGNNN